MENAELAKSRPTQVAQIMSQHQPEPKQIIKIYPEAQGMLGLDNYGNTYLAVQGTIDKSKLFWQLLIKNVEE